MSEKTKILFFTMALSSVAIALFSIGWGKVGSRFQSADKSQEDGRYKYVGVIGCKCHMNKKLGRQFQVWTGSKHARSYLVLETGHPEMVDEEAKGMVEVGYGRIIAQEAMRLGVDTDCLKCHATSAGVDTSLWEPTFHVEDGVQCEACHGPASGYMAMMMGKKGKLPPEVRPKMPTKEDCMVCHREKPSHAVLKAKPFDFEKAWKKIAHPIPKK